MRLVVVFVVWHKLALEQILGVTEARNEMLVLSGQSRCHCRLMHVAKQALKLIVANRSVARRYLYL